MEIVWKLIVGGIIGWLASKLMRTDAQMGIIANILVGIFGSLIGHFLAPAIGLGPTSVLGSWLVAIGGAVLLIIALKTLKVYR